MNSITRLIKKTDSFRLDSHQYNRRWASLITSVLILWIVFSYFLLQNVHYETNDDNAMAGIAYGLYGHYDPHLIYINIVVGYLLQFLLTIVPTVPWYTVLQCILLLLSFWVVIYLFFARFGTRRGLLPTVFFLFYFGTEYLLKLQFSKTAGIATLAGILLLFDAVEFPKLWKYILGGLLALFGSLYRFQVFGMVLFPLLGIGISLIWEPIKNRDFKRFLRIALPFVIVFTLCFGLKLYDSFVYNSDPDWQYFFEFNNLRSQLLDYGFPNYQENIELYTSLGITESDLQMFCAWDFADPDLFNVETLRQLVAAKQPTLFSKRQWVNSLIEFLCNYWYSASLLVAAAISVVTGKLKQALLLCYEFIILILLQLYLFRSGRYLINRIDVSLICAVFLSIVFFCWGKMAQPKGILCVCLTFALVIVPFIHFDPKQDTETEHPIQTLISSDEESLYLRSLSSGYPSMPNTFDVPQVGFRSNYYSLGGWTTNMPTILEVKERFGISNPFKDCIGNPNVYLLCSPSAIENRIAYIRNHYHADANAYIVKTTEDGYSLYQVSATAGPSIDTANAIDGCSFLHCDVSYTLNAEKLIISGFLYQEEVNSFASNIYIGIIDSDNKEQLFYTTQYSDEANNDLMNGAYGNFYKELSMPQNTCTVRLYLEVEDKLYYVQVDPISVWSIKYNADISTIDLLPYLTGVYDCQVTESESGLIISETGVDSQLYFSIPETKGLSVVGVNVEMETQESSVAQIFTATQDSEYSQEKSCSIGYEAGNVFCMLDNPDVGQPVSMRFDPTQVQGQVLKIQSIQLVLADLG